MPTLRSLSAHAFAAWSGGLVFLFALPLQAVPPADIRSEYLLESWNKERGLPDNTIYAINQTSDGYLWVATRGGLARFDGTKFTIFNRANSPEMPSDECRCLAAGANGELWIGTGAGLLRRTANEFTSWLSNETGSCSQVNAVHVSPRSGVWIATHCALYHSQNGGAPQLRIKRRELEYVGVIIEDRDGRLWLGTTAAAWRFDPVSGAVDKLAPEETATKYGIVEGLALTPDGAVWSGFSEYQRTNEGPGFRQWIYAFKDGAWTSLPCNPLSNMGRPSFISVDNKGALWVPNGTSGLVRYSQGALSRLSFFADQIGDCPTCFFCDREGNIWVGTETSGILVYRRRSVLMFGTKEGLPHDNTWTICQSRDGSMWIGTDGGVSRLQDGRFSTFTQKDGLTKNTVRSIVEDSGGTIWVGTGRGLNFYQGAEWRHFPLPNDVAGNKIRVLYADRAGDVWVGREYGLARIHNHQLAPLTEEQRLAGVDIRALLQDRTGALWIGTYGDGVLRIAGNRIDRFSAADGLASRLVWALHEDAHGVLWLGTDRGLHRYSNGRFSAFTEREGLFDRGVNHILEDHPGNFWISCDRGIYRVPRQQLEDVAHGRARKVSCVPYGPGDGLLSTEANGQKSQPAACKTTDGRLWFATAKGVAVFDPAHLPDNPHPPQPVIEQVRADGQVVHHNGPTTTVVGMAEAERATAGVPSAKSLQSELQFGPDAMHVLEIQFTANTMTEAGLTRFEHWLVGVDRNWIDAGTRRTATYAHLSPGHYRFRVRAISKYGITSRQASEFSFHLKPHFYQTWMFYLGCGALLGAAGFSVYRWRLSYLHRIHGLEKAKALAEDRARIARDLHDSLGAQLTNLAVLASVSEQVTSAVTIETRFRKLARLARETALELKEIIWANHPGDETLEGLATRICQYAQQSLGATGVRCSFDIAAEFPSESLMPQARHHLHLAAKEAIHNVLKHASATELRLHIEVRGEWLRILIEDNGRGPSEVSRGNGLANMRCRIEALHGTFSLSSRIGGGTSIRFDVPVGSLFSAADLHIMNARPRHHNAHDDESLHR